MTEAEIEAARKDPVELARATCRVALELLSDDDLRRMGMALRVAAIRHFSSCTDHPSARKCAAFLVYRYGARATGTWLGVHAAHLLWVRGQTEKT